MANPRLSLHMIARDEEEAIARCLRSVANVADEIVVVDTGSSDKTVEVAKSFGAKVIHHAWNDDFSEARNRGLDQITGEWVLCLDADEELAREDVDQLKDVLDNSTYELHTLTVVDTHALVTRPQIRLWKNRPQYRYRGRVHEHIDLRSLPDIKSLGAHTDVRLLHHGYQPDTVSSKAKKERNMAMLSEELESEPNNIRSLYHLAQEHDLPELDKAVELYQRAFSLDEEGSLPDLAYKLGIALKKLKRYDQAIRVLKKAIKERFPDYPDLHFVLGQAYFEVGKYDEAVKSLRRCLKLGPSFGYPSVLGERRELAKLWLGFTLGHMGKTSEANDTVSRALADISRSPSALLYLGKLYLGQGPPAEAEAKLRRMADLSNQSVRKTFELLFGTNRSYS